MAFVHGKNTVVKLAATDLSAFTNASSFERDTDEHDVTCYGATDHVVTGGLGKNAASMGGVYDNGATGPREVIEPLIGTVVTFIRQPEGTGSGLPQDSVSVLVKKYVESSPVADMVTWSLDMSCSGPVNSTPQT